ncbi:MAG TPA: hypothetical protein VF968_05415, partial [Actinomycetota bacterium]
MYRYHYKIHPFMHGKIRVPIKVSPADGGTGTVFTNTLSAASRAGYSFEEGRYHRHLEHLEDLEDRGHLARRHLAQKRSNRIARFTSWIAFVT